MFILCKGDPFLTLPIRQHEKKRVSPLLGYLLLVQMEFLFCNQLLFSKLNSSRVCDKAENILLLKIHLFLQSLVISAYCTGSFSLHQDFSAEIDEVATFLSDYM